MRKGMRVVIMRLNETDKKVLEGKTVKIWGLVSRAPSGCMQ